jgi:hemoglobin
MTTPQTEGVAAPRQTPYDLIGGAPAIQAIVDRFYDLVETEPRFLRLRAMHETDLEPMRRSLASFLSFWFGGPQEWRPAKSGACVMAAHAHFLIDHDHAQQWIDAMSIAIADNGVEPQLAATIKNAMTRMCAGMINN